MSGILDTIDNAIADDIAQQFVEAMKGIGAILADPRWGQPRRPERVSRLRRAYRAKRRHRW